MTPLAAVLVDAAVWAGWGALVGWTASHIPAERLATDSWVTRSRRWERQGRTYERLGVRRWKDRLPEAGGLFGGPSKRRMGGYGEGSLRAFAVETRRAELVHWVVPAAVVVFPLWNPWGLTVIMVVYAMAANAPCVLVQRYNRARIARLVPC